MADHPPFTWQKIECHLLIKDSAGNILTDEDEIISLWWEYFDFLNPIKASTRGTHEVIRLEEKEVFTAVEMATSIKEIKSEKAAGENEIKPEMLKALTEKGILCLTRVCRVAWKQCLNCRGNAGGRVPPSRFRRLLIEVWARDVQTKNSQAARINPKFRPNMVPNCGEGLFFLVWATELL